MTNKLIIFIIIFVLFSSCKQKITIVTPKDATNIETFAAGELRNYLSEMYPGYKFQKSSSPGKNKTIYLEVTDSHAEVPANKEGYLIRSDEDKAFIFSRGETGLVYGVYGVLEKLGCGFYLSDEFIPEPQKEFDFEGWNYTNEPLIKDRFVFNWHNFISGCTGWDKQHWINWIDRSQKMGFNTIMVHAYHNNPMHTYSFNGIEKDVGYICTSANGFDWGNIPVNDVRRLPGGEIFHTAEFGSEIAMVPDDQRVEVAQQAMAEIFSYANSRGIKVNFSFDIDMPLTFLQNTMIESIPEEDKFYLEEAKVWIPKPDKPEGYEFYKSQIEGLLDKYNTLTGISFFRRRGSYFAEAKLDELPAEWQKEFHSFLHQYPYLKEIDNPEVILSFITAKLVRGYQQVLIDLDRPFKPTVELYSKLKQGDSDSFGVFHWLNRPLDLFFKNMGRQVWSQTKNESLDVTCKLMAGHYFGSEKLAVYFMEWMSNAPMFGRSTHENFFYRPMDDGVFDFEEAIKESKKRIAILKGADVSLMQDKQIEYLEYFKTLEQFIIDFSETQPHLLNAEKYLDNGDLEMARKELKLGDPTACVKTFSRLSQLVQEERGEMAFTYRLATKYIPDYTSFEQRARLKPFYINIDSVVYEDLAQGNRTNYAYHIDKDGNF